ncbi:MAG: DUF3018 family protein [Sinobacteraceae bacterium]|nr:DUF3018 family protein [Nevskiaceae bacterium]
MVQPTNSRVRKYREQQRKAGLKLVQIWVPDVDRRGFAAECRRQALLVRASSSERRVLRQLESIIDTGDWT